MNNMNIKIRRVLLAICFILIAGGFQLSFAQALRWIRVGQLESFFKDYSTELS